jgi:hypothetical protein
MNDSTSAFVLPFILLRPFLNPHKSILIITLLGFFLNNILMYLLLRKLKLNTASSFLGGLIFGFMPFLSQRIQGHYTYIPVYFFPLIFFLIFELIKNDDLRKKILLSIGLGISLAFLILINLYYFFIALFGILFYVSYYFFQNKELLIKIIKVNLIYFIAVFFIFLIVLAPWITQVYQFLYFDGFAKQQGFAGSQSLSADFINFFLPSEYNPIYRIFFLKIEKITPILSKVSSFFFSSWERFAYPGIIILFIYTLIIFFRKKFPTVLSKEIQPHFIVSLFFALFSMGPFLKIFNRWAMPLGDGINFIIPLPFLILHYFPILNSLRAPMRFNPGFVFLAVIVSAYVLDYFFNKIRSKKNRYAFFLIVFFIFIFDQLYVIQPKLPQRVPNELYQIIKNDKEKSTVLEIPFTARDGFQYLGFVHAISIMNGPLIYEKPVIGGYLARLSQGTFDYYRNLPFIGYVLKITDKGNYDPYKEQPKKLNIFPFPGDIKLINKEVDFLNVKYIILKNSEEYSFNIAKIIEEIGFKKVATDTSYDLFVKQPGNENYEEVNFGLNNDYLFAADGFSANEDGFRWGQGKSAKVFIKTDKISKRKLIFEALSFYKSQKIKIYINKRYVGEKEISIEKNKYTIDIGDQLESGINTIYFQFSKSFTPAKLWSNDQDARDLAVKFFFVKLE